MIHDFWCLVWGDWVGVSAGRTVAGRTVVSGVGCRGGHRLFSAARPRHQVLLLVDLCCRPVVPVDLATARGLQVEGCVAAVDSVLH